MNALLLLIPLSLALLVFILWAFAWAFAEDMLPAAVNTVAPISAQVIGSSPMSSSLIRSPSSSA